MFSSTKIIIGTGSSFVFHSGGERPERLATISRPTFLTRARGVIFGVSEVGHGEIFRLADGPAPAGASPGGAGSPVTIRGLDGAPLVGGIAEGVAATTGQKMSSGGSYPCHISAAPDGSWIYVSNYGDGVVRAVAIDPDGEFGERIDLRHSGSGPKTDRQEGPHAHFSAVVDDHLVIADLGTDHLRVHELTAGRPSSRAHLVRMPAGSGPRHFTRAGRTLVVAGELDGTVTEVDIDSWSLGRSAPAATAPGTHHLSHILALDGMYVVGVRGSNTLSLLDRDLRIVQEIATASWPRHFAVADSAIVVAGERGDELVWHPLEIDSDSGGYRIGEVADRLRVSTPMFVGIGEDF